MPGFSLSLSLSLSLAKGSTSGDGSNIVGPKSTSETERERERERERRRWGREREREREGEGGGGEFAARYYEFLLTLSPPLSIGFLASPPLTVSLFSSFRSHLSSLYLSLFSLEIESIEIGREGEGEREHARRVLSILVDWAKVVEREIEEFKRERERERG